MLICILKTIREIHPSQFLIIKIEYLLIISSGGQSYGKADHNVS